MSTVMNEVSIDQLKDVVRGKYYNVESTDSNAVHISFSHALVEMNMDSGEDGEIVIFKPGALCECSIDCNDIVASITANEDYSEINIQFNNGMSDMTMTLCKE